MRPAQTNYYSFTDPRAIPGCTIWIDAQDSNTVTTTTGSVVTDVRDKSVNAYSFSNGNRMTYNVTKFNTIYPSFFYNGTAGGRLGSNASVSISQPFSVFVVGTSITGTSGNRVSLFDSISSTTRAAAEFSNVSGNQRACMISGGTTLTVASGTYPTFFASWDFNSSASEITINGQRQALGTVGTAGTLGTILGGTQAGTAYRGHICEILVYSRIVSISERQQLEGYLAWKWGLRTTYSETTFHPFYNQNPSVRGFVPPDAGTVQHWFDAADNNSISSSGGVLTTLSNKGTTTGSNITVSSGSPTIGVATQNGLNLVRIGASALQFTAAFPSQSRARFFAIRPMTDTTVGTVRIYSQAGTAVGRDTIAFESSGRITETAQGLAIRIQTAALANQSNVFSIFSVQNSTNAANNRVASNGNVLSLTTSGAAASYLTTSATNQIAQDGNIDFGEFISFDQEVSLGVTQQIEGYLAWKWGVQGSLPSTHPYKALPPYYVATNPSVLSRGMGFNGLLRTWLDASDRTTVTLSGSNVTVWAGKSRNRGVTLSGSPVYKQSSFLGGRNVISFNGTNDSALAVTGNTGAFSIFLVTTQPSLSQDQFSFVFSADVTSRPGLYYAGFPSSLLMGSSLGGQSVGVGYSNNITGIYSCVFNSTASTFAFNGGQRVTINPGTGNVTSLYFGRDWTGVFCTAEVGEVLVVSAVMSVLDQFKIEGYLAWKWGLQDKLPGNHPYKNSRP
jgi:hypothetical protein